MRKLNKIINTLFQWRNTRKKHRKEETDRKIFGCISSYFEIKEFDGEIYLTCHGTPFEHLSTNITTNEIKARLEHARQAAMSYFNQKNANLNSLDPKNSHDPSRLV